MTFPAASFLTGPLLAAALVAAAPAWAQPAKLVPAQSEIQFTSRQMGVPVDGKFRKFDAQVDFDPKKPETARIALSIDLASINLGAPESEAEVVKPLWFNVAKFPQASFTSTGVKATGPGKFDVTGKLNIKGNVRDMTVPVVLTQAGGATTATGGFVLKRTDFKIGEGEWADTSMVANDVQVKFKLQLTGIGAL
ncbi:MAG: YceI family protein [Aquincola tertiaricarbonis]